MSVSVTVGGGVQDLLAAIGLTGADGHLDSSWFDDPLGRSSRVLADPQQRAALLRMLDTLLPADASRPGWHPLLDDDPLGNLYLTVEGDVIGVAGALHHDLPGGVHVTAAVRLPLVDVAGDLRPIAGSAAGPVRLAVELTFDDATLPLRGIGVDVTVDVDRGAGFVARLRGVDLGAGPTVLEVDSHDLGGDLVHAVHVLLDQGLQAVGGERLGRLADHLFALLGIDGTDGIPALPLEQILRRPEAVRDWLVDVVGTPATLRAWAGHLAGLIGVDRQPTGTAVAGDPMRAPLLAVGPVDLDLIVELTADRRLDIGLAVRVAADLAHLDASATVLSVPLDGGSTQVVPRAAVLLIAPGAGPLVDDAPAIAIGTVQAGFRLLQGQVQPWLALTGVVLDSVDHGTIDLTDADAVTGVVTAQVDQLLADAFGDTEQAKALLALLGLRAPGALDGPAAHPAAPLDLLRSPLGALAGVHRAVLGDDSHPWSEMLGALASLLGVPAAVTGAGVDADPWLVPLAAVGPVSLSLAAWNARDATTPAGEQRLRLGLYVAAVVAPFTTSLRSELLAIDLPATGAGQVALLAEQRVVLAFAPGEPVVTPLGLTAAVDAVTATARWKPGDPLRWAVDVTGLAVQLGAESYGPFDWIWPDGPGPDLGPVGLGLVRLLVGEALSAWGGDAAYVLGALVGLHRGLPSLPVDWPVLEAPGGLGDVLADPAAALRDLASRLFTGISGSGAPFATSALRIAGALLRSWEAPAGTRPDVDVTVTGSGSYPDPWAVPLPATGGESADLLVWLDPDGPPADWLAALIGRASAVASAAELATLLADFAPFTPTLRDVLTGRDDLAAHLDTLAAWLRDGDGLVPLVTQLPAGWTHGSTVTAPHARLPQDPGVLAQVSGQLGTWAPAATVYVAPSFADHTVWAALAPDAVHVDMRVLPDPREVDLTTMAAVSTTYTADLLAGVVLSEVDQLERVIRRVCELTGAAKVALVAHSTAGVTARLLAAAHPDLVHGLITIGTPHAPAPLVPLTDDGLAGAVRVAATVAGPIASSVVGATIVQLAALLDGAGGPLGPTLTATDRAGFTTGPAALAAVVDAVPRLAIGSAIGGDPIGLLAGAVATGAAGGGSAPTHLGFGMRITLDVPAAAANEIALIAKARIDLSRIGLGGAAAAAGAGRPSTGATVTLTARRPGGWLVGAELAGATAHVRWMEAGVTVTPGAPGAVTAHPWLRLHDAGVDGPVGLDQVTAAFDAAGSAAAATVAARAVLQAAAGEAARIAAQSSVDAAAMAEVAAAAALDAAAEQLRHTLDPLLIEFAGAAPATPAALLLELVRAAGLVADTADGVRAAAAGITALAQTPMAVLTTRRDALLAALQRTIGGALTVTLDSFPLELALDLGSGTLRLHTTAELELAGPLRARLDATLDTGSMRLRADAALLAGPVALTAGSDGSLAITAAPWLDRLELHPFDAHAVERTLLELVPRVSLSAAVSVLLGGRVAAAIGPVDALLRDPVGWLRRSDALGTAAGELDGAKINDLLKTLAGAIGLDATDGMLLPGGFLLSATGSDPARITLSGSFDVPTVANLAVDIGIDVRADRSVTPTAKIIATIALPGQWGTVVLAFSQDAAGLSLIVTPEHGAKAIQLLPTVDGLGLLVGGATALLPKALQEAVGWLRAQPGTHDVLDIVLNIAAGFGIYGEDVAGFTDPTRVAALRGMLQPGWMAGAITDSGALATLAQNLFAKFTLPAGHTVTRVQDRIRWAMPVSAGCTVFTEIGWGAGGSPQVLVGLTGLDTGPVVITSARLGWLDGLTGALTAQVDPGGEFAFFAPTVEVDVTGTALTARLLPLGAGAAMYCALDIVPTPRLVLDAPGPVDLVTAWLVPLVSRYLLPLVEDLLDRHFWSGGPTARGVLTGAGLISAGAGTPQLADPLPDLPSLGLGALSGLLDNATVHLTDSLDLSAVSEAGRLGLRVRGTVLIGGEDVDVTVLLGRTRWTPDPADGITVWLLRSDNTVVPPLAIAPAVRIGGLGIEVHGHGGPLIDGAVVVGGIAAVVFADVEFLDAAGAFALGLTGLGGAVGLEDAQIVLSGDDGDSFVAKILPAELRAPFGLAIGYRNGVVEFYESIGGTANGIELTFPLDLDLFGVIFLRELLMALTVTSGRVDALAAISGNASLGPVAVAFDRVGLRMRMQGSGVAFSFKPPDGFGLSLDVSVVTAGGFLLVDEQHGRYVGAIEIAVLKKFDLTAIGIVTTKKPDGSPGFSLLLLITVQLPVPIPIGYGFFFAGAGGLLGLNRGMDVDRIRSGLRNGTADSILFPTDIVRRIDVIVRDLEESFPQHDGHFLIGPMVFIQWMNPALVTAKVGVIIEIAPQPNIAILGVLRIALPTPDEAVVDLKVAFLGSIDIAAGLLSFDASIYDSTIGYGDISLRLEGDIAIRLCWGSTPDLVASIGGFHPNYTPATNLKLPAMRRISLSLLKDNPRLTLRLYLAVTSNTVQFGAQLELFVGVSGFSISGDMGFDVLVQVAPFLIDAHMWAHLAVKAGGTDICSLSLDLSLRGPTPWLARGTASFSLLFISVSVEVEARFGEDHATSLPSVAVLNRLLDQFRDPKNWAAEISADAAAAVSLFPVAVGLVVDAGGVLSVRQNLIPLATDIALVGTSPPADISRATITDFTVGATTTFSDVTAPYAPSTFAGAPTTDADRLRAPAFEQRPTGARSHSGSAIVADLAVGHQTAYERIVLDDPDRTRVTYSPPVVCGRLVAGGVIGTSAGAKLRRANAERGTVTDAGRSEELFAVTGVGDLRPLDASGQVADAVATLMTRSDAESRTAALAAQGRRVQIVPEVQLVR